MTALLVAAAFVTAVLSGMAGMGGGTLLIALMFALGMQPALALPLHAGVQFAANASRSVAYGRHVRWPALALFALTAVPGPFLVAPWVVDANPDWIRLIMAVFIAMGPMMSKSTPASPVSEWLCSTRAHPELLKLFFDLGTPK